MSELTIMAIGIPMVGLNLLDFCVVGMIPVILLRWGEIRERLYRSHSIVTWGIWFVAAAGVVGLVKGYVEGYALRTGFRDFRFYFYLPIMFHYGGLFGEVGRLNRLVIGLIGLVPVQTWMIYQRVLLYNPSEVQPYAQMFSLEFYSSLTHYLPLKSYFPMLIGMCLLLVAGRHLHVLMKILLSVLVASQLVGLGFSYSRSSYLAVMGGLLAIAVGVAAASIFCVRGAIRLGGRLTLFLAAIFTLTLILLTLVSRVHNLDTGMALKNMQERLWSVKKATVLPGAKTETDASIEDRVGGLRVSLHDMAENPIFGTGLGNSHTYSRAVAFHNVFLWMGASVGAPAAIVFVLLILLCCLRSLRALRTASDSAFLCALWVGFFSWTVALSIMGLFQPYITNFLYLTEWGFLLGVLSVLTNGASALDKAPRRSRYLAARWAFPPSAGPQDGVAQT